MERYKNLGGNSSVIGFDINSDSIVVYFSDGTIYLYSYISAGSNNIEEMKSLAQKGQGLNHYIMTNVRFKYEKKLR